MNGKLKGDQALGVLLVFVAARSGNWFITPASHPGATALDYALTGVQLLVCLIAGMRLLTRATGAVSAS